MPFICIHWLQVMTCSWSVSKVYLYYVYSSLHIYVFIMVNHWGKLNRKSGQNIEAETEAVMELCFLWLVPFGCLRLLFYMTQHHLARDDTTYSKLASCTLIIDQDTAPHTLLQATKCCLFPDISRLLGWQKPISTLFLYRIHV